jgi:tetratricopeptide (TPR) repeat protein
MNLLDVIQDTRQLYRAVWLVLATVIGVTLAFTAYYYWDRYVHLDDQTPLEMDIRKLEDQARTDPNAAAPRLALAEQYLNDQRYPEAIDQAQQVLRAYPENESARLLLGLAHTFSGETKLGAESLEQFIADRRDSPMAGSDMRLEAALYYLGEAYLKLDHPSEAITVLEEALSINPTDADALYQRGVAYLRIDQCQNAIASFNEATRYVPDFAEAYHGMGECYTSLGMLDHVYYARGMTAFSQQDFGRAIEQLRIALERLPGFTPALLGLGLSLEQIGDLEGAKTSLEQVVALEPENFVARNSLNRILMAIGK